MLELKEDTKKIADEKEIQTQLNNAIDNNNNFVFDAGAGHKIYINSSDITE